MAKRISLSVPEWWEEQYLTGVRNRSAFVVEMVQKGVTAELGEIPALKNQSITLLKQNRELEEQLRKIKLQLSQTKNLLLNQEKRKKEREEKIKKKAYKESVKRMAAAELRQVLDK